MPLLLFFAGLIGSTFDLFAWLIVLLWTLIYTPDWLTTIQEWNAAGFKYLITHLPIDPMNVARINAGSRFFGVSKMVENMMFAAESLVILRLARLLVTVLGYSLYLHAQHMRKGN